MAADISVGYGRISVVGGLWSDVSLLLTIIYTYLKILAMENVKIQGLSELISRDLRPSVSHIFMRNFSSFNRVKLFTKSLHETFNFFRSHYGHLIVLEGLIEMIVTFSFR